MTIPFLNPTAQYQSIKQRVDRALVGVLNSGNYMHNLSVKKFEEACAQYVGARFCVGMNSGYDAMYIGLRALGLDRGDEIAVAAHASVSIPNAIVANGLQPVFIDIDAHNYRLDLADLAQKISPKTKAVIVPHHFGYIEHIDELLDVLHEAEHKIELIEELSMAFGAEYKNRRVGTFGLFAVCSFYPGSVLSAYGDAGALITRSAKIAEMARLLSESGQDGKYRNVIAGAHSQLDEMQAAVLEIKLDYLESWRAARAEIADYYHQLFFEKLPFVVTLRSELHSCHTYAQYVVAVPERDRLCEYLKRHGIHVKKYAPVPLHLQRAFMHLGYIEGDLPHVEEFSQKSLLLPIYPELSAMQCRYIVNTISDFYNS
ncbi:MAG: dTDP-3-amino-3,6-dideoxy-alpha-D-galactopyranose transaminase [Microgenomates bacterium OLB23]|nr:MAG: dTDP-3-amino-3,6-dideoxy-alpha-D-galactopyranose transaminase [Microgenomates bacterium OLB23]